MTVASYIMIMFMCILSANNIAVPFGCYLAAFAVMTISMIANMIIAVAKGGWSGLK